MHLQDHNSKQANCRRRYFSESEKGNVNIDDFTGHSESPSRRFLGNVMEKLHIRSRRSTISSNIPKSVSHRLVNSLNEDLGFPPEEHESPPNVVVPLQRSLHDVIEECSDKDRHQRENINRQNDGIIATCLLRQNRVIKSQGVFLVFQPSSDQVNNECLTNSNTSSDIQMFNDITNDGDLYESCSNIMSECSINDSDSNISPRFSPVSNYLTQQTHLPLQQHPGVSNKKRNSLAQKIKTTFKGRNRAASLCTSTLLRDSSLEQFNNNSTNMSEGIQITNNSKKSGSTSGLSHSFKATNMMYSRLYQKSSEGLPEEISHSPRGKGLLIKESTLANMHVENSPGISSTSYHMGLTEINKIIFENQDAVYSLFMKAHKCYDVIPTSSKLVILDIELPVKKAFFALIYNGVRAAPLYDSKKQEFVGMLTITDFISILIKYYNKDSSHEGIKELEEQKISQWREQFKEDGNLKKFITIDPQESLYKAVQMLCEEKIHRLPVLNSGTGNVNYILTHKRLIKFLNLYLNDLPKPVFMDKTPKELGIGCWENVISISINTPLVEALKIFLEKRVSALPLVDDDGRVVDIYAKFDAINLCSDKAYINLDITVSDALSHRSDLFEGVKTFRTTDSLISIVQILVESQVHRLVAVDDENKILGIVSLSDILRYLILDVPNLSKNKSMANNKSTTNNSNDNSKMNIDENGASCISIHNTTNR
uniref:5'-AMP-activated protein kinase subunit gamma-1 n=2 Tax=Strongyloides stercoralis TaxID=6248 RepID=A0A0K0E1G0_STRER